MTKAAAPDPVDICMLPPSMACTAAAVLVLTMFTLSPCLVNRFSFSAMK